jgi:hypothetical protein
MAVMILFLRSNSGILFTIEFATGGMVNLLSAVKKLLNGSKGSSIVLFVAAALCFVLALLCFGVVG